MPTLEWIGKSKVVNHHQEVPFRVLERQYSFDEMGKHTEDNGSDNMIIHGDNLEALKALLPQYEGRVKCIYIDPPYNTGNEKWCYNDNVNDPHMNREELDALERMPVNFAAKIRAYVMQLQEETARENFYKWLETEKIVCEPRFQLTEYITLPDSTSSMSKSLYQTEGKMDGLEYKMALAMTNMDNIRWWHRNPERNKFSFCLNGFRNHYPDFIVRTTSGKILLIETKGDQLENAESREKIRLGRAWQDAAGKQAYRYYMVFQNKDLNMEGAYRFDEFLTLLREL